MWTQSPQIANFSNRSDFEKLLVKGANVNQIARRINSTNRFYDDDVNYIKEVNEKIWQSLNSVQSKLRSL